MTDIFNFPSIKYLGKGLSFLKKIIYKGQNYC